MPYAQHGTHIVRGMLIENGGDYVAAKGLAGIISAAAAHLGIPYPVSETERGRFEERCAIAEAIATSEQATVIAEFEEHPGTGSVKDLPEPWQIMLAWPKNRDVHTILSAQPKGDSPIIYLCRHRLGAAVYGPGPGFGVLDPFSEGTLVDTLRTEGLIETRRL